MGLLFFLYSTWLSVWQAHDVSNCLLFVILMFDYCQICLPLSNVLFLLPGIHIRFTCNAAKSHWPSNISSTSTCLICFFGFQKRKYIYIERPHHYVEVHKPRDTSLQSASINSQTFAWRRAYAPARLHASPALLVTRWSVSPHCPIASPHHLVAVVKESCVFVLG
jgi:hypothetical protein